VELAFFVAASFSEGFDRVGLRSGKASLPAPSICKSFDGVRGRYRSWIQSTGSPAAASIFYGNSTRMWRGCFSILIHNCMLEVSGNDWLKSLVHKVEIWAKSSVGTMHSVDSPSAGSGALHRGRLVSVVIEFWDGGAVPRVQGDVLMLRHGEGSLMSL
jgi:hypothetical protein